jgi:hypothetical protein
MVSSERSPLCFLPTDAQAQASPPPPYPTPPELPPSLLQQPRPQEPPARPNFQLLPSQVSPGEPGQDGRPLLFPKGLAVTSFFPALGFDLQSVRSGLAFPQKVGDRPASRLGDHRPFPRRSPAVRCSEWPRPAVLVALPSVWPGLRTGPLSAGTPRQSFTLEGAQQPTAQSPRVEETEAQGGSLLPQWQSEKLQ